MHGLLYTCVLVLTYVRTYNIRSCVISIIDLLYIYVVHSVCMHIRTYVRISMFGILNASGMLVLKYTKVIISL